MIINPLHYREDGSPHTGVIHRPAPETTDSPPAFESRRDSFDSGFAPYAAPKEQENDYDPVGEFFGHSSRREEFDAGRHLEEIEELF